MNRPAPTKMLLALTLLPCFLALAGRTEPENMPDPRTRTFPHIDWCVNYEGGIPRILFIAPDQSSWEIYALAMRMDLDYDVFYAALPWKFAPDTDYYHEGIKLFPQAVAELRALLKQKWDVIAFVDFVPYMLPTELHYLVLESVAAGTGVVTFNCARWQVNFRYPGVKEEKTGEVFQSLPQSAFTFPKTKLRDEVNVDTRGILLVDSYEDTIESYTLTPLTVRTLGKGRIVEFTSGGGNYFGGPAICPAFQQDPEELLQSEYFYSLGAKLVNLAAGREPKVRLVGLDADGKTFEPGKEIRMAATIGGAFSGSARVVVRTPRNKVVHEATMPVKLEAEGSVAAPLPSLPAGRYYVDMWLRRGGKTVDWASAHMTVRAANAQIKSVTLAKKSFTPREAVSADVTATGASVTARVLDGRGRILVAKRQFPVVQGKATVSLPLDRTREQYHVLAVDLVTGGLVADTRRTAFVVTRPWEPDLLVFSDGGDKNLLGQRRFEVFREHGITTAQIGQDQQGRYPYQALAAGHRIAYRLWHTHCNAYTGGCISSRSYPDAVSNLFQRVTSHFRSYGLQFVSVGDDSGTAQDFCKCYPAWVRSYIVKMTRRYKGDHKKYCDARDLGRGWGAFRYMAMRASLKDVVGAKLLPADLDLIKECWRENYRDLAEFNRASGTQFGSFDAIKEEDLKKLQYVSPCVLGFRDAMKARYGEIATLNAAWGTQLKSFEEITSKLVEELVPKGRYGAKLDKTWYLQDLFIRNMAAAGKGVRSVSKEVGVGMGAATFPHVIPEVLEQIDSVMPYKGDRDLEVIRSAPHRFCGQTIGVYGGKKVPASARENQAWETVFTGGNFIWFWATSVGGLMGDLSTNPGRSGVMLANIREMQQGLARALISGKRLHDGIAILEPRRASALSGILKAMGTVGSSQVGFQRIIEDLGMQYRYTWTKEVESGVLRTGEFKILILPYTQILSDKEVAEIEQFVKGGGTVMADLRVATHDWHGRPLAQGRLDGLFGIRQNCAQPSPVKAALEWKRGPQGEVYIQPAVIPGIRGDQSVSLAGAKALATLGDSPAVMVNAVGSGRAVFLNQAPTTYNILLNRGQADSVRALYRELFALGGARTRFRVVDGNGNHVAGAEIAVFKHGPVEYLTLEKNSYEFEKYPIPAKILLDRESDVYDVRAAKRVGFTSQIPITLNGLGCYVYALLPYRAETFAVDIPDRAERGGQATVSMQLRVKDGVPGPHTVRVDVYRPTGKRLWPMYKQELGNGRAQVAIPIALNEELGKWTIVATDVTTGRSVTRPVTVVE